MILCALLARYNIKVRLFADDVKLYVKVINAVDITVLHEALAALVSWADEWQLSFLLISVVYWCFMHC